MDVTPLIPEGKQIIKGYGDMAFKVNEQVLQSSIIIMPDKTLQWDITQAEDISTDSLQFITENANKIEILLIGCGEEHQPLPPEIQMHFSQKQIGIEMMTTGAACRTYNVLLAEGRKIAAALIAV